jgi:CHAD domain-containing protein
LTRTHAEPRKKTTAPAGIDRATPLLRERIRSVFRRMPQALAGDEEALHQMRIGARRLRVALPLLAHKPEGRRVRRSLRVLRQVTRSAGASRDLDVGVALLAERRDVEPTPQWALLRRRMRSARARSRTRMADALLDLEIAGLRRNLRAVLALRAEGVFMVLRRLRETRAALGAEVLAAIEALGETFDAVALHQLRIRVRRLRYLGELSDAFRGQVSAASAELKAMQDQLGLIQDAFVLSAWFGRQASAAQSRGQQELAREARAHKAYFVEQSHAHHRAFLAQGPADAVRRALAAMSRTRSAA